MHPPSERANPPWASLSTTIPSLLRDLPIIVAGLALFYGLISLAGYWAGPVNTQPVIQLSPFALPKYALFSVARILAAYLISLVVPLVLAFCHRSWWRWWGYSPPGNWGWNWDASC